MVKQGFTVEKYGATPSERVVEKEREKMRTANRRTNNNEDILCPVCNKVIKPWVNIKHNGIGCNTYFCSGSCLQVWIHSAITNNQKENNDTKQERKENI